LSALPNDARALWATALLAGLRRGELRALRWRDIDLDENVLRIERGWDDVEGEQDGKTRAARRTVPLVGDLRALLVAQRLATGRSGGDLVFGITADEPFDPSTIRRRALKAWKSAGLTPIGLHECRHTFASFLIASDNNIKAISTYMGHASVTITIDRYGHLLPDATDESRMRLQSFLDRQRKDTA
jgi:integrase